MMNWVLKTDENKNSFKAYNYFIMKLDTLIKLRSTACTNCHIRSEWRVMKPVENLSWFSGLLISCALFKFASNVVSFSLTTYPLMGSLLVGCLVGWLAHFFGNIYGVFFIYTYLLFTMLSSFILIPLKIDFMSLHQRAYPNHFCRHRSHHLPFYALIHFPFPLTFLAILHHYYHYAPKVNYVDQSWALSFCMGMCACVCVIWQM